jgi:hypothetical protein
MKDDLRMLALAGLILLVMYCVGSAVIETVKAFAHALAV